MNHTLLTTLVLAILPDIERSGNKNRNVVPCTRVGYVKVVGSLCDNGFLSVLVLIFIHLSTPKEVGSSV